jgi:AcrR family transcriptional regulator
VTNPPIGLRERKKQLTRQAIADAALRLTLKKGLSHVTLEEIAEVAFISPRTVTNYFSRKEAAIVAAGNLTTDEIVEHLYLRPADETPPEALGYAMLDLVESLTPDQLELHRQKIELSEQHPTIKPYLGAEYQLLESRLAVAIAERIGAGTSDLYSQLLAAAATAALRLSLELWASDDEVDLIESIDEAFALLRDGFTPAL